MTFSKILNILFFISGLSILSQYWKKTKINLCYTFSGYAYGVTSTNRSSGVMYADYFMLEVHTRLEKESETKTKLNVIVDITWDKPCLMKSKIETETVSGMKKYYEVFEREIMTEKAATGNLFFILIVNFFFKDQAYRHFN